MKFCNAKMLTERLIKNRDSPNQPPVYYMTIDNIFDIIKKAPVATGHSGHD